MFELLVLFQYTENNASPKITLSFDRNTNGDKGKICIGETNNKYELKKTDFKIFIVIRTFTFEFKMFFDSWVP